MSLDASDLFTFVALRSPEKIAPRAPRWRYIRDDAYHAPDTVPDAARMFGPRPEDYRPPGIHDVDLFSSDSPSSVGRRIAGDVVAGRPREEVIARVEALLVAGLSYGSGSNRVQTEPVIRRLPSGNALTAALAAGLQTLRSQPSYVAGQRLHVLPGTTADLPVPMPDYLAPAQALFARLAAVKLAPDTAFDAADPAAVAARLGRQGETAMRSAVFAANGRYDGGFAMTKRVLFDMLYGLYVLRRRENVDLDPVMQPLATLQMVECLAVAEHLREALAKKAWPSDFPKLAAALCGVYPELLQIDFAAPEAAATVAELGLLGPQSPAQLAEWLAAPPVVHPLIARLDARLQPFNTLKPIGLGDLKVVKQTFRGYRKAEIAHIETVLDGETKTRTHRALDRSENSFLTQSSSDSDSSRDTQSTARYELKNEAEQVLKTDVGVNASATINYKGSPVVDASLTAGVAVASSRAETERTARNFVDEVLSKATSRIQTKVASQRSQVRISETEETSVHTLANPSGEGHVSGMYRWLEKVYKAQVHNYGRRMMFEFILPEPAEFYVEARLAAHAAELGLPRYPVATGDTDNTGPKMPVAAPADIDEAKFAELARSYDLSAFSYPPATVDEVPVKTLTGDLVFRKSVPFDVFKPPVVTETFSGKVTGIPDGYRISRVRLAGKATFANSDEGPIDGNVQNTLSVAIQDQPVYYRRDETLMNWPDMHTLGAAVPNVLAPEMVEHTLPADWRLPADLRIAVTCHTCTGHELSIYLTAERTAEALAAWRQQVFDAVAREFQRGQAGAGGQDLASRLIAYQRKLDEIKGTTVNDLIRGRSEAWNDQVVRRELKRQCLSMIAMEFDADGQDDLLNGPAGIDGVGGRAMDINFPVFNVTPGSEAGDVVTEARAAFEDTDATPAEFTLPKVGQARARGRLVQFLEQAFEWPQLSYVFYPYFWARMPQWVKLMHREDVADPFFTDFLQAGSARTLLSVRPGYENAVLHFLATREPWSGGPSPVIGDALFLPLYEEVRQRQDDMAGAVPVGEPWEFAVPTALVYLESRRDELVMAYPTPGP